MSELNARIESLDEEQLVRVAIELFELIEPDMLDASADFERDPPGLSELGAELASALGVDATFADEAELARRLLSLHAEDAAGARELDALIERVGVETMGPSVSTAALVAILVYVLRDYVSVEADNSGEHGRVRWRVQLGRPGGDAPGPALLARLRRVFEHAPRVEILLLGNTAGRPAKVGEEFRHIEDLLRASPIAERFVIHQQWELPPERIAEEIVRVGPSIVHFAGHANSDSELLFRSADGSVRAADVHAIASLFGVVEGVRLVTLSACYAVVQAELIAAHVDAVLGINGVLVAEHARVFAAEFYQALAFGRSLGAALALARTNTALAGYVDAELPRLHTRPGVDAGEISLL